MAFDFDIVESPFEVAEIIVDGVECLTPALEANLASGETQHFHWFNSQIRRFAFAPDVDHVEARWDDRLRGIRIDPFILATMEKYAYPLKRDPYVDAMTQKWFADIAMREFESEINEL